MNVEETELCRAILSALLRRPISRLFLKMDNNEAFGQTKTPLTFSLVESRLERGLYKSPDEFSSDIRAVLGNVSRRNRFSIRLIAADTLAREFDRLLARMSPSLTKLCGSRLV